MKKTIAIILVCTMASLLICVEVSATAENTTKNIAKEQITSEELSKMTTEEIAYLDLASADKETKDAILAARNEIIFSQEWVADGYSMEVVDAEGNVKRTIPKFSEVFPGWDLPKATRNNTPTTLPITLEDIAQLSTEEIAYLNLENADEEAKEAILAARSKIIYTREWAADGYSGYVTDKDGNIKRVLPNFSEVFPGWELPKLERKSNPTVQPKFINFDIDLLMKRNKRCSKYIFLR